MAHIHSVFDSNEHFVIDPLTRAISNSLSKKIVVMQYDHNSERFSFEIPKLVDGHNMNACDRVEIHYINIDATDKSLKSTGVYEVDDIQISPNDNSKAVFSWLLSRNATKYAGTLNFLVHFACTVDGVEEYAWNTAIFQSITIGNGMNNGEEVVAPYTDIIAQWKADLFGVGDTQEQRLLNVSAEQQAAIAAKGEAVNASIPDEYEVLYALADQNHRKKAGAIVLDAEGESIIVNDASDCHLQGLKLFGKSTQDGTPTPDAPVDIVNANVSEIVAFGGNLIPYPYRDGTSKTMNGITYTVNEDGSILVNGTATDNSNFTMAVSSDVIKLPKGWVSTSLGIGFGSDIVQIQNDIFCDGAYLTTIQNQTEKAAKRFFETNVEFRGSRIKVASGVTVNNVLVYPVFCIAENAIPYEPFAKKQTATLSHILPGIPVSSGGNYTDADGQQYICDEVDLERGVYIKRIGHREFDGSADESWFATNAIYHIAIPDKRNNYELGPNILSCSHFRVPPTMDGYKAGCISETYYHSGNLNILVNYDDGEGGIDAFKRWLQENSITVLYALAAPTETPLSDAEITAFKALHSNKPNTTILNDAGAFMAVEYVADTKTYIDNKISEILKGGEEA